MRATKVARNTTSKASAAGKASQVNNTSGSRSAAKKQAAARGESPVLAWMVQPNEEGSETTATATRQKSHGERSAARRQALRDSMHIVDRVRGRAWALWVHRTAERILDADETLPSALKDPALRALIRAKLDERKLARRLEREGSDRIVEDDAQALYRKRHEKRRLRVVDQTGLPPVGQVITGRDMDYLVGRGGNGWTRWENAAAAPDEAFHSRAEKCVPGSTEFWTMGPGRYKGDPVRFPLWAMLAGSTSVEKLWLPVMLYKEGQLPNARSLERLGGLDTVAYTAKQRHAGASGEADDGVRPLADTLPGDSLSPEFLEKNRLYHAHRLASFGPGEMLNLVMLGSDAHARARWLEAAGAFQAMAMLEPEPLPEELYGLLVADVLVLALATSFTAGERRAAEWRTTFMEDKVFYLLRTIHRRVVTYAAQYNIAAPVRRWLRRMHSDYLDRNDIAFMPSIADLATLDAESFTYEGARPSRRRGDQRLSRQR